MTSGIGEERELIMAGDSPDMPGIPREEDSLALKLKEVERENSRLARELRTVEKRCEVLRLNLDTLSGMAKTITGEKLRQELYVRLLLEFCPDIIMAFDEHMQFLLGTESIKSIIAVDDISLLQGRGLYSIIERYAPVVFTDKLLAAIKLVHLRGGMETPGGLLPEEKLEIIAGKNRYECRLISFRKEANQFAGFLVVMNDITDLAAAREQAEQASRSKGEFLSRMSHEMRTPMNAIIGMTGIARKTDDPEKIDYCLDKIDNASAHLLGVINDVLDMSKIEAGKLEIAPHLFDFADMLDNVVNVLRFPLDKKKQKFVVSMGDRIPSVVIGDEMRLTQVLTNLLSNAVKFTPEGGAVTLSVKCLEDAESASSLLLEVSDTGIGISEEQQSRLFNAFEQAEGVTARKFGGTGLGLAISKRIVELMGGKIWVESQLGHGATFAFNVILQKGGATQMPSSFGLEAGEEAPAPDYAGHNILIAEDVEINREIIAALLEDMHLGIDFAENGLQAVRMFEDAPGRYHLILMDVQMPEMDGYEATRRIRSLPCPEGGAVPIVAMTANVFKEDVDACLASGMNAHLGKPIEISEVYKVFRRYLAQA